MNTTAKQEIMRLLNSGVAPPEIVRIIAKDPSQQRQTKLALALQDCWRKLENTFDERAVYQINDQWASRWPDMENTISTLLTHARNAQMQPAPPTPKPLTQKPTTMPMYIYKPTGTINNYDHCTFYAASTAAPQTQTAAKSAQIAEDVQEIPPFFRTDSQSLTEIEKLWQKALDEPTKTKVIRFVLRHDHTDGYFRLGDLTYQQRAEEFNKAQDKFLFNASDFENANRK